jgi:hypothetical protein
MFRGLFHTKNVGDLLTTADRTAVHLNRALGP